MVEIQSGRGKVEMEFVRVEKNADNGSLGYGEWVKKWSLFKLKRVRWMSIENECLGRASMIR